MQDTWKMFAKSASWLMFEKILRIASGVLVTAAIARYLGPNSYGYLAVILGTVGVVTAGATMGAGHVDISELSVRDSAGSMRFLSSAILARVLWSVICLLLFLAFIFFEHASAPHLYLLVSLLVPISALTIVAKKIQADGDFARYSQLSCFVIAIGAVVKLVGIYQENSIGYFVFAAVLDGFLSVVILGAWVFVKNKISFRELVPEWRVSKSYLRLCFPTAISAVFVAIYFRLELFMVSSVLDGAAAGLWAGVMMFITPWRMVASSILTIANRHLSKGGVNGGNYEDRVVRLIKFMLLVSVFASLFNSLIALVVVPVLLGDEYREIHGVVWIASLTIIPLFLGAVQEVWIAHQKTTSIVLKKVIVGLPLSFVLLYVFIATWGLKGAAFGMVVSYFVTAVVLNYFFDRKFLVLQLRGIGL